MKENTITFVLCYKVNLFNTFISNAPLCLIFELHNHVQQSFHNLARFGLLIYCIKLMILLAI